MKRVVHKSLAERSSSRVGVEGFFLKERFSSPQPDCVTFEWRKNEECSRERKEKVASFCIEATRVTTGDDDGDGDGAALYLIYLCWHIVSGVDFALQKNVTWLVN